MLLQIVLRGISGVGKSTLRKLLTAAFLRKGFKVVVQSKDDIRKEVERSHNSPYNYTEEEERLTSWLYTSRVHALLHPFKPENEFADCILICDNTHVNLKQLRESEFCIPDSDFIYYKRVLIEVGTFDSLSSKEHKYPALIQRQRTQLIDSAVPLHNWCKIHYIPQFWINDHTAIEDGVADLVSDLIEIKKK